MSKEIQRIQESARLFANRRNGTGSNPSGTLSASEDFNDLKVLSMCSRALIFNEDGTLWQPQNTDGSLPALRGYDYPADME